MGYYTHFKLEHDGEGATEAIRIWMLEDDDDLWTFIFDDNLESEESTKWYDHDFDMLRLSNAFPHILFTLHGEGEENGDVWRKYYRNGRPFTVRPVVVWPDIDLDKEVPAP